MVEKNTEIRQSFKDAGIKHWQVADEMHISEATMVRKLRRELSEEEKTRVLQVVEQLKAKRVKEIV